MLYGLSVLTLLYVSLVKHSNSHTVEICYNVEGGNAVIYAGTYHSSFQLNNNGGTSGGVLLSGVRYDFTSYTPAPTPLEGCSTCPGSYPSVANWQRVEINNLAEGTYTVETTTDTVIEDPWCPGEFPNLLIVGQGTTEMPTLPSSSPTNAPTTAPTFCHNNINTWDLEFVGKSSQFKLFTTCVDDTFVKIRMVSLTEMDSNGKKTNNKVSSFANDDWHFDATVHGECDGLTCLKNAYDAALTVGQGNNPTVVGFQLETQLFYEAGDYDGIPVEENTFKWNVLVQNEWPWRSTDNSLELCINIMTNSHGGTQTNENGEEFTVFEMSDFVFSVDEQATCDGNPLGTSYTLNQKNDQHTDVCWTFDYCDGVIQLDPFVWVPVFESNSGSDEITETDTVLMSVFIPLAVLAFIGIAWMIYYKKRKLSKEQAMLNDENTNYESVKTEA